MRPVHLALQAFGSYPAAEEINFTTLADSGLFLVTGPTGSGKTTLFDAISFALYGTVPGDRPDAEVRSHHADLGTLTEVTLVFEANGERYRVFRRPKQTRPRRNGVGEREVAAEASLHRWHAHGWQPVETTWTKVGAACTEAVGLKAEQFQKVVLLPQGRFAEFLLATSKTREDLLRQLFGTTHIDRATQALVERAKRLAEQVGDVEAEVEHHRRSAIDAARSAQSLVHEAMGDALVLAGPAVSALASTPPVQHSLFDAPPPPDEVQDRNLLDDDADLDAVALSIDDTTRHLDHLARAAADATSNAAQARDAAAQADDAARRHDQHHAAQADIARLVADQVDCEREEVMVEAARRARPVVAADSELARATADLENARRTADDAHTEVAATLEALGAAPAATPADATRLMSEAARTLGDARERLRSVEQVRNELRSEVDRHAALTKSTASIENMLGLAEAQRAATAREIDELTIVVEPLAELTLTAERLSQLEIAARRRDRAAEALTESIRSVQVAEQAESALLLAFATSVAPRLAATLVDGHPCAVCGSTEHPAPAVESTGSLVDESQLEAARRESNSARDVRTSAMTSLKLARDDMGDSADFPIEELRREAAAAATDLEAVVAAARRLADLRLEIAGLDEALDTARAELAASAAEVAAAAARVDFVQAQLAESEAAVDGVDIEQLARHERLIVGLEPAITAWAQARRVLDRRSGEHDRALATVQAALAGSGFTDVGRASAAFVSDDELDRLDRRISTWRSALEVARTTVEVLIAQGVPDERPDTSASATARDRAEAEARRLGQALAAARQSASAARRSLDDARAADGGSSALRAEAALTERVAKVCNGQVAPRISLETWVLAHELQRVAESANVHLQRMTHGRYTLRTIEGITEFDQRRRAGLDLEVFDAHTGRQRSPRTLSGGEQFQAALSLALGLADVVSRGGAGNGMVFEALFVDEGFGSLDPEALDDAIEALGQLQAGGRMVGVITHVEAMKQQLPVGIAVHRRADGRGSTLRCA